MVTAGLMCAPDTPPTTMIASVTPNPHPQLIVKKFPFASCSPSLSTTCPTTPSPKTIRIMVPKNSARNSLTKVFLMEMGEGRVKGMAAKRERMGDGRGLKRERDDVANSRVFWVWDIQEGSLTF